MMDERAALHDLKLADLRDQLRDAHRTIALLKENKEAAVQERKEERDKERSSEISKAVEEERRRGRRIIAKHESTIKALEKQLADEKSAKTDNEKVSNNAKKQLAEMEGKYKFEMNIAAEQFEAEKKTLEEGYRNLEASYVALLREKERELLETVAKAGRDKEDSLIRLAKQHKKDKHGLQGNMGALLSEKDNHIVLLDARLQDAALRITALDNRIQDIMDERQRDVQKFMAERQQDENRHKEELAHKDALHHQELDVIYERIKNAIAKKDASIVRLKAELALAHKKIQDISQL